MDPISALAAGTVAALAPYLAKAGEEFAKEAGKATASKIAELYQGLKMHFKNKPAAKEALADLEAKPENKRVQAALRRQLKNEMKADSTLIATLQKHLAEIEQDTNSISFINQFYGGKVEKLTQIGGDVEIVKIN